MIGHFDISITNLLIVVSEMRDNDVAAGDDTQKSRSYETNYMTISINLHILIVINDMWQNIQSN